MIRRPAEHHSDHNKKTSILHLAVTSAGKDKAGSASCTAPRCMSYPKDGRVLHVRHKYIVIGRGHRHVIDMGKLDLGRECMGEWDR
jgi:hypothetical protein